MTKASTIKRGKEVYEMIRASLELKFPNQYVAIEPISKEYFIDVTVGLVLAKAKAAFPYREFYTTKIGKETAFEFKR